MEIQPLQILFQIINFGLVAFVLVKFLYHPIAKVLESRSLKIKEGMDAAEKNVAEKEKLAAEVKAEMIKARKEATKIIAESKKQADAEAQKIIADAKLLAKKAADNERDSFESMLKEAESKAEAKLQQLVTSTTAKVLADGLSEAEQHKIIESQLKRLKSVKLA